MFLFRYAELLKTVHFWTIRLLVPPRFRKAMALNRYAARDELATSLAPSVVDDLEWVFRHRAGTADLTQKPPDLDLAAICRRFGAARFRARYRMWHLTYTWRSGT